MPAKRKSKAQERLDAVIAELRSAIEIERYMLASAKKDHEQAAAAEDARFDAGRLNYYAAAEAERERAVAQLEKLLAVAEGRA